VDDNRATGVRCEKGTFGKWTGTTAEGAWREGRSYRKTRAYNRSTAKDGVDARGGDKVRKKNA